MNIKNYFEKILNSLVKISLEIFITDKFKRSRLKSKFSKSRLKKYINIALKEEFELRENKKQNKIIWQYWHQNPKNAPKIINSCLNSVKKYMDDYSINVLSLETIKDFVKLPKRYYDLLNRGKISVAHFSDILRLYLLNQYGGSWIDSTIFLTDRIPNNIMNSNFFVYQKNPLSDCFEDKMSCFFIKADKEKCFHIKYLKKILDSYWQNNDFAINYFMFEHISSILSDANENLKNEWQNMPVYYADELGILQKNFSNEFSAENWKNITDKTPIHKLTHKKDKCNFSENSFYNYIIKNF